MPFVAFLLKVSVTDGSWSNRITCNFCFYFFLIKNAYCRWNWLLKRLRSQSLKLMVPSVGTWWLCQHGCMAVMGVFAVKPRSGEIPYPVGLPLTSQLSARADCKVFTTFALENQACHRTQPAIKSPSCWGNFFMSMLSDLSSTCCENITAMRTGWARNGSVSFRLAALSLPALLGSFCTGCVSPKVLASCSHWKSSFSHLHSLFSWSSSLVNVEIQNVFYS